jgi:hypothetical protein
VSEWSAAGSLGRLADLTPEALGAPSWSEEGGGGLDLVGTPLTESDGGDERSRLPGPDLVGAALAVVLLEWSRLGAEPSAVRECRRRRVRTVS